MTQGFKVHSKVAPDAQADLFTEGAVKFLVALHRTFESRRQGLLSEREDAQRRLDSGVPLDFPPKTAHIRAEPSWHCVPPAPGLEDRRVEITGPTDRKMVVNALNSGAKTFMADFEGMLPMLKKKNSCVMYFILVPQIQARRLSQICSMVKSICATRLGEKLTLRRGERSTNLLKILLFLLFGMFLFCV